MNKECIGLYGYLFGHQIVTVYDTSSRIPDGFRQAKIEGAAMLEALKTKISTVKSIHCIRCGETVPIKQL
jgi:hypothetical protein